MAARALPRAITHFIPPRLRDGTATELLRLRLAVTLPVAHGAFGLLVGLIFVAVGFPVFALPFLVAGPACVALPFVFRRTGSVALVAHLQAAATIGSMFVLLAWTNGARGPMSLALLPSVLSLVLLVGFRGALPWGIACLVGLAGFWLVQGSGLELPLLLPRETIYEIILPAGGLLALLNMLEIAAAVDALHRSSLGELERANAELERARREADASNDAKSVFLANMSHEIRTPMNAIVGMTDLILEDTPDGPLRERLEIVQSAARNLTALVDDILDLSKIQAGHLGVHARPFSLRDLVVGCARLLASSAREHGATLTTEIPEDVPDGWLGDPSKVRQILVNLVANAIKFSDGGEVWVSARRAADDDGFGGDGIVLVVADDGRGIPPEALPTIFEPFARAANAAGVHGTGLGLSIVKGLVDAMGGDIRAESDPGRGSRFTVALPLALSGEELPAELTRRVRFDATAEPRPAGVVARRSQRVLIVEDNAHNQLFLADLLGRDGAVLHFATDADEARRHLASEDLDLVLMDLKVPGATGLELAAHRRGLERDRALRRVPMIAVTAQALNGTREACLGAGLDDLVEKPIDATRLRAAIRACTT